jgi:single-stranded DNA-binding protein
MAQPRQDRKFINGFFAKRFWQRDDAEMISIGLKKDEFIRDIEAMSADDRGFINLTMGSQKADPAKFSLFPQEDRRDKSSSAYSSAKSNTQPSRPSSSTPPPDDTDDLPF